MQEGSLEGKKIIANPAWSLACKYVEMLERVKSKAHKSKILLVLPQKQTEGWFRDFVKRNKWKVVRRYPIGSKLFTRPST